MEESTAAALLAYPSTETLAAAGRGKSLPMGFVRLDMEIGLEHVEVAARAVRGQRMKGCRKAERTTGCEAAWASTGIERRGNS